MSDIAILHMISALLTDFSFPHILNYYKKSRCVHSKLMNCNSMGIDMEYKIIYIYTIFMYIKTSSPASYRETELATNGDGVKIPQHI